MSLGTSPHRCATFYKAVRRMIKPDVLRSELPHGPWSCRGCDVWDAICAAVTGDAAALRRLLERDPNLYRAEYWYTPPIHFAVREGHLKAVQVLLDAGAEPTGTGPSGEELVTMARDRGHEGVARLLEDVRARRSLATPADTDHPIHLAATAGDAARVRALLDAEPQLVHRSDRAGGTPLHLLLDRGADIHALHGAGPGSERGYGYS
jgi:ankyrin repeat protein